MASITLTASQYTLLGAVVEVQSASQLDWNTVAEAAGLDTGKKARENWPTIRKKLEGTIGDAKSFTLDITQAQKELLNAVIGTKIDFNGAAEKAGLNTAKKARENYATIKKKLTATADGEVKKTKKTTKRKADGEDSEQTEEAAPAVKKPKTKAAPKKDTTKKAAPKKGKKGAKSDSVVDEEQDETAPADSEDFNGDDMIDGQQEPYPSMFGNGNGN